MIIACQNIEKSFGENTVLKSVNFHLERGDKCAIVGVNGAGKTTLLRIILGQEESDSGVVSIARDSRLGYLSQNQDSETDNTIYGVMQEAKSYLLEIEKKLRELEKEMEHKSGSELQQIMETYNRLSTTYDRENGYAYESEITGVIAGLGFSTEDYDRPIGTLSGGQKMRVALGRLLLSHPDIIILDEPTNHLDTQSTTWLEGYLSSYSGTVIVVSHDRYFIDKVTNKIIDIENGVSTLYNGSYSYYREEKSKKRQAMMNAYLNQQAEIKHQEEVITKLKQFNREKSIKRAESREKLLDKIDRIDKPEELRDDMRLKLTPVCESGEDVLHVEGLSKAFGENLLFKNLSLDIKRGEHVALIGGNGTGKTTILKMINRLLPKDSGSIELGAKVRIGYFDQEHHDLNTEKTIFEEMSDSFPDMNNTRIRNTLAAFLFTGEDVFKKIGDLSGGERGRLSLAKLMLSPANLLILDEPTNHLDISSREILEDAIKSYSGTVLFVSHDRYFINKVADRILELKSMVLTNYIGNYEYYEEMKDHIFSVQHPELNFADLSPSLNSSSSTSKEASQDAKSEGRLEYESKKAEYANQRKRANDLKKLEKRIAESEKRIAEIDTEMAKPENGSNASLLMELSSEKEELEEALLEMYEQQEELM